MTALESMDLDAVLAPIHPDRPMGTFDDDDETFQGIDREMVKLGSLQEAELDWAYVDKAARQYLAGQCKHLRTAIHLSTARLRGGGWRGWGEACAVLSGFIARYWQDAYPKPGAAGLAFKRRLAIAQVERLGGALPALSRSSYAGEFQAMGQRALDELQACAAVAGLDTAMLATLESRFAQRVEAMRSPELAAVRKQAVSVPSAAPLTEAYFDEGTVRPGQEREHRRSVLALAEWVNRQDAYDPTGYQLRRFALWAHLSAAPGAHRDGRTELMGAPIDTAAAYADALKLNQLDPATLQRIEKSVVASPYWLRGSYLAADVAQRLDMSAVAQAIRLATQRFVARLPALVDLQFADGRPFVDADTRAWLETADARASVVASDDAELRAALVATLEREGVEAMLRHLDNAARNASHPRHCCHIMATAADLLHARGLPWLAEGLYVRAHSTMLASPSREWEPDFFERLDRHVR